MKTAIRAILAVITACGIALTSGAAWAGTHHRHVTRAMGTGEAIADYAATFVGKYPYAYGGNSPETGFDCPGLAPITHRGYWAR